MSFVFENINPNPTQSFSRFLQITLKEYYDFLDENELENNLESIDLFNSYMYYDVCDEVGNERVSLVLNKIDKVLKQWFYEVIQ